MYLSVRSDEYQHLMTDSPTVTREMRKRSVELGGVDPNLHAGVTAIMCGHYARQSRFFYIFRKYRHGDRNPYVLYGMVAMVVQIDKSSALVEARATQITLRPRTRNSAAARPAAATESPIVLVALLGIIVFGLTSDPAR